MHEMYKPTGVPDDSHVVPVTYEFVEPHRSLVKHTDGRYVLTGWGVGEKIEVLEPRIQYLIASYEPYDDLPLSDGSFILDAQTVKMRRVW